MKPIVLATPVFALALTLVAYLVGLPWWIVLSTLFLSAPAFFLVAYAIRRSVKPRSTGVNAVRQSRTNGGLPDPRKTH